MHPHLEHALLDAFTEAVVICSLLHSLAPPWDAFSDYPRFQRRYKLFIYIVGYIALNGRSTVYQNISVGKQVAKAEEAATERASSTTTMTASVSVQEPKGI